MKELQKLIEYGKNYTEYKPIHDELKKLKNGWTNKRDKYEEAHRAELTLWNAASRYLHANLPKGTKPPLPISEWEKEYATLSGQRTAEYTKLKETRAEVAELHNIRKCVDIALKADQPEQTRSKRHDLETMKGVEIFVLHPRTDRPANQSDLVSFLQSQGEQLTRAGNEYRWKRHDSLTVRGNKWYRHSQSKGGGPVDFVMEFFRQSLPKPWNFSQEKREPQRRRTDLAPRPSPTSGYRPQTATTKQRGTTSQPPAALMKM